jgi:hypothetical protein
MNRIIFVLLAFSFIACGGKSGSALDRNHAGSGTGMLLVTAQVDASNDLNSPTTNLQVDLADGTGNPVSSAIVTVHNLDFGDVTLVEATAGSGHYVNSRAAVSNNDFGLDVSHPTKGAVTGVAVGNPGMQLINAPAAGATVPATQQLAISWTTPISTQSASVDTRNFSQTLVPDTGTYTLAAASNPANTKQVLKVQRYNSVIPAGGIVGSLMSITTKASVTYVVQ